MNNQFANLSDDGLITKAKELVSRERDTTLQILRTLAEIEKRKIYLERGYSSIFQFCVEELGYSESAAQRRISGMRFLRDVGTNSSIQKIEIEDKIQSGRLNLSQLSLAQKAIRTKESNEKRAVEPKDRIQLIKKIEGRSYRNTERVLAEYTESKIPKREIITSGAGNSGVRMSITVDQETLDLLQEFKNLYAVQNPSGDTAAAIKLALRVAIQKKKGRARREKPTSGAASNGALNDSLLDSSIDSPAKLGNYTLKVGVLKTRKAIPAEIKREAWEKYKGQCNWVDQKSGRKCGSRYRLELDHKIPVCRGGDSSLENLQLLCRNHNAYKSDRVI